MGDPVEKTVCVPSTDKGLTRNVEFIKAIQGLEVTGETGFPIGVPVRIRRKEWKWDKRTHHRRTRELKCLASTLTFSRRMRR